MITYISLGWHSWHSATLAVPQWPHPPWEHRWYSLRLLSSPLLASISLRWNSWCCAIIHWHCLSGPPGALQISPQVFSSPLLVSISLTLYSWCYTMTFHLCNPSAGGTADASSGSACAPAWRPEPSRAMLQRFNNSFSPTIFPLQLGTVSNYLPISPHYPLSPSLSITLNYSILF